ncbi:MAG: TIR domain-containing protein [Winogradskyella sp.]|nr:TIR domain-containing protein [Winogradskyella sp.]
MKELKIFISYRRKDSDASAGRIYDSLRHEYKPENLFKDIDSIPLGANFKKVIESKIAECDVVLAIIGHSFSSLTDDKGKPRILKEHDFVNMELSSAIKLNKIVIPVFVDNGIMPKVEELPDSLSTLPFLNGLELRHSGWSRDIKKLIEEITRASETINGATPSTIATKKTNTEKHYTSRESDDTKCRTNKINTKQLLFIALGLIVISAIAVLKPWGNQDEASWKSALQQNSIASYESYKLSYPNGNYTRLAKDSISSKMLRNDYNNRISQNDINGYKTFLEKYPSSRYTTDITARLVVLQNVKNTNSLPVTTTQKNSVKPKALEVTYYNTDELLLESGYMALFIKNTKNVIDINFCQNLSQELQKNNINASISFFNQQSLQHYNSFYSANSQWVNKIQLPEYVNTYLIGHIGDVTSPSIIDSEITRVKLTFTGKLINVKSQTAISVNADADESSYDAQEASKEAYRVIVNGIITSLKTKI